MVKIVSNSTKETQKIIENFVYSLRMKKNEALLVGLYGNLGAGKTTVTQFLAKTLNIKEVITSPTFVIMKIYDIPKDENVEFERLVHIDAYRLEKPEELLRLGFEDIISDNRNLILIEWPERIEEIIPSHIKIKINHLSENSREIEIINE